MNNGTSPLKRFFSSPLGIAVGTAGSIASIISLPLAVYFFLVARERPDLTYAVHPTKAAVVRPGQTSRVSVLFDGRNLTGDITAAQVAFWNAGRKPIRGDMVLSPLVIQTSNRERILEVRLRKTSRNIVRVALDSSRLLSGEVGVNWNILEQNDGAVLQLIYVGNESVNIRARAVLVGQPEITRLTAASTPEEEYAWKRIFPFFAYALVLGGSIMTFVGGVLASSSRKARREGYSWIDWLVWSVGVLLPGPGTVAVGIWMLFGNHPSGPPFNF